MRIVFTGPPCSGKSSVFDVLKSHYGYQMLGDKPTFIEEVARASIKYFMEHEPEKLPWNDRDFFQPYVETTQLRNFHTVNTYMNIFDRGLVDEVGYRRYFGLNIPFPLYDKCLRYRYDKIFYFPLWQEIFKQDDERIEEFNDAVRQDQCLRLAYGECNYELIEVPKTSVEERLKFVLSHL